MFKRIGLFICDVLVIAISGGLALLLRDNFETSGEQFRAFLPYIETNMLVGAGCIVLLGLHHGVWRLSVMSDYLRVVALAMITVAVSMAVMFMGDRLARVARAVPIIQIIVLIVGLVGLRVAARVFFIWRNTRRRNAQARPDFTRSGHTVLVVGLNRLAMLYIRSVEDLADGRLQISGLLAREGARGGGIGRYQVLGRPEDAREVIQRLAVQGVFVTHIVVMMAKSEMRAGELRQLGDVSRSHDINLAFFGETLGLQDSAPAPASEAVSLLPMSDTAMLNEQFWRYAQRPYWRLKRVLDVVGSVLLIVFLTPLFLLVACIVAVDVGLPVIFWQQRPGARGVPFRVYKFRTMRAAFDQEGSRVLDTDRVSIIGQALRATRMDELPQLFNVLVGEMSFIGPRPLLPVDQFPGLEARLAIAPGITGWAQVNGGREISAADKAALDLWYLQHASLRVDAQILKATIATIIRGENTNHAAISSAWQAIRARASKPQLHSVQNKEMREAPLARAKLLN